jgi:hypothetical protein
MSEWQGATIPVKCHDCKRTYLISKLEYDTQDAVCKDCFDAFDGMTIKQLVEKHEHKFLSTPDATGYTGGSMYCACGERDDDEAPF